MTDKLTAVSDLRLTSSANSARKSLALDDFDDMAASAFGTQVGGRNRPNPLKLGNIYQWPAFTNSKTTFGIGPDSKQLLCGQRHFVVVDRYSDCRVTIRIPPNTER